MKYAVLNSESKIINLLSFEDRPSDLAVFLEGERALHSQDVSMVEIEDESSPHNFGFVYNGKDFKPEKPFDSWIWDEAKWIWRPPSFHPEGSPELSANYDDGGFKWNEQAQEWVAK